MSRRRAIVVKVEGNRIYVMTESRHFRSVLLPRGEAPPRPGEIMMLPGRPWVGTAAVLVAGIAAAFLIGFYAFAGLFSPAAVAYLELEMNPRLVLELDAEARVIDALPFNEEARILLEALPAPAGTAYAVCSSLIGAAADLGYLQPGDPHVILATAYPAEGEEVLTLDLQQIEEAVLGALSQRGIAAFLGVSSVGQQVAAQARTGGLSVGRQMLRLRIEELGIELPAEVFRDLPLGQVFERSGVGPPDLIPGVQPPAGPTPRHRPQAPRLPFVDPEEDPPAVPAEAGGPEQGHRGNPLPWEIEIPGSAPRPDPGRRPGE